MQRMSREINKEFATVSPSAIYALAVVALHEQGDALNQIGRLGRRLLTQYQKLTEQLLTMRQLFPPVAPDAPDFEPQNDGNETEPVETEPVETEPVETKLTQDDLPETAETESVRESIEMETKPVETKPVETKLIDSVSFHFPFPYETRVHSPHSISNAISRPTHPVPNMETEEPTKVQSAGCL
jgi:hypothetical protein